MAIYAIHTLSSLNKPTRELCVRASESANHGYRSTLLTTGHWHMHNDQATGFGIITTMLMLVTPHGISSIVSGKRYR